MLNILKNVSIIQKERSKYLQGLVRILYFQCKVVQYLVVKGVTMKRLIALILVLLTVTMTACGTKNTETSREYEEGVPDCVVSNHSSDGDYRLIILANQDEIDDKEAYAKMLIEKVQKNDFHTIMFSYDMSGYPTSLHMSVYLSEADWKERDTDPYMEISFTQEDRIANGYNIVDDYDKFTLEID